MTVSDLLEQPCNKSDNINTVVNNLGQAVRTQLVDGLLADFLQDACVVYYVFSVNYPPGVVFVPPALLGVVVVGGVAGLVEEGVVEGVVVGGVGPDPGAENNPGASDCRFCIPC